MNDQITTADQLDALPLGCVLIDQQGDLWMVMGRGNNAALGSPETGTFHAGHVLKKWGPLVLRWRPDEAAVVLPTEAEIADALHADACPEDPDDGECCTCADYLREARIILELFEGVGR